MSMMDSFGPQLRRLLVFAGTMLVVILLCGPTVLFGYNIVLYSLAEDNEDDIEPWAHYPGLTFSAMEASLSPLNDRQDQAEAAKRRDDIAKILSIRPMESEYWLAFADARVLADDPLSKALGALTLSALTGPNEAYVIAQRGIFGVTHWEVLSPEIRARAIANLTEKRLSERNAERVKAILATKTPAVRDEIRAALKVRGFSDESFSRVGL